MAPLSLRNPELARKIATLQLRITPLVQLPNGPPHPDFPKTLMDFHLLTEDQLDSIAHCYHQSTPGRWSSSYPETMNWDKEFLARPIIDSPLPPALMNGNHDNNDFTSTIFNSSNETWWNNIMSYVEESQRTPRPADPQRTPRPRDFQTAAPLQNPYVHLTDFHRICIKRRKVGKFIGLPGMETPTAEIFGRIQAGLERVRERTETTLKEIEEVKKAKKKGL